MSPNDALSVLTDKSSLMRVAEMLMVAIAASGTDVNKAPRAEWRGPTQQDLERLKQ